MYDEINVRSFHIIAWESGVEVRAVWAKVRAVRSFHIVAWECGVVVRGRSPGCPRSLGAVWRVQGSICSLQAGGGVWMADV